MKRPSRGLRESAATTRKQALLRVPVRRSRKRTMIEVSPKTGMCSSIVSWPVCAFKSATRAEMEIEQNVYIKTTVVLAQAVPMQKNQRRKDLRQHVDANPGA